MKAFLQSELTCPHCDIKSAEEMPTDACVRFHECRGCGKLLEPRPGDCCVFCSFGSIKCPPVQAQGDCCGPGPRNANQHVVPDPFGIVK